MTSRPMVKSPLMQQLHYAVRPMERRDIPQVTELDREAFPGEWSFRSQTSYERDLINPLIRHLVACTAVNEPESTEEAAQKSSWFKRLLNPSQQSDTPEKVLGFTGFWMMLREAHITAIGVRDGYRRLGIGEALLIATIDLASTLNADEVTLEVRASNEIAQALYRKYGFKPVGKRLRYYSSDGEDAVIMSTDRLSSVAFQATLRNLKKAHAERHGEILSRLQ